MRNCVFASSTGESVWPSQQDQINADPKENRYWLAWMKIDGQLVNGSESLNTTELKGYKKCEDWKSS